MQRIATDEGRCPGPKSPRRAAVERSEMTVIQVGRKALWRYIRNTP
jgi:hypothetical protein